MSPISRKSQMRFFMLLITLAMVFRLPESIHGFSRQTSNQCSVVSEASGSLNSYLIYVIENKDNTLAIWKTNGIEQKLISEQLVISNPMSSYRVRLSPSGKKLAILSFDIHGDPARMSQKGFLQLIQLDNMFYQSFDINIALSYVDISLPTSIMWSKSDISWDWLDDTSLIFNWESGRNRFDTQTGTFTTQKLLDSPWKQATVYTIYKGIYVFYGKSAMPNFSDPYIYISAINSDSGVSLSIGSPVNQNTFAYSTYSDYAVGETPNGRLALINLLTGAQTLISRQGWSEFNIGGMDISSDGKLLAFYNNSTFPNDTRLYVVDTTSKHDVKRLCKSGDILFSIDQPSWSKDNFYQFSMDVYETGTSTRHVYGYNSHSDILFELIPDAALAQFKAEHTTLEIAGWGNYNAP